MENNRIMAVYTTGNRNAKVYKATPMSLQDLFKRLEVSQPIPYTIDAYKALPKAEQDDLKDIGGFVLGELRNGRRKAGAVLSRSGVVLDADSITAGETDEALRRVAALGVCAYVYSTAKHCPSAPRLRIVIPFAQGIPADQYPAVARLLCRMIQEEMTWFDPTTAQAERMMYWAAHCQDVEPVHKALGGPLLDAADLLARQLPTWQDPSTWPRFPSERKAFDRALRKARQQDPTEKTGIVGAFCRAYDVPAAMEAFLPGAYEGTATEGRYTFTAGSSFGGALLYDDGKFLHSHHATDPAGGKLVNAWDLVRLHRFGDLDDSEDVKEGTPPARLPSWAAMAELALADEAVADELAKEALASAKTDFQDETAALELAHHAKKPFDLDILRIALRAMGTHVRRNLITGKVEITDMPPKYSPEEAVNTLPVLLWDMMKPLQIKGGNITAIQKGLGVLADENRFNPVLDMLQTTDWDGMNRLPVLLDILNIEGGSFYALLVRKWLIQCVALVHNTIPGYLEAAEGVLTIQGDQGIGKTMLFRKLAVKPEWFAEGVTLDMKNKDSIIQATGVWIAELGELESTLKKEQTSLKSFITQKVDSIRAPYAAEKVDRPRHTSFGATVNPERFLKDDTGDRRFWVVPVHRIDLDKLLELPPDWFAQLWEEVYIWWMRDPQGFRLSCMEREHLNELNQQFREMLPGEEEVRLALDWDLPREQWRTLTASQVKLELFCGHRITSAQVGRVLAKLAREEKQIEVIQDTHSKVNAYHFPLQSEFAGDAEANL